MRYVLEVEITPCSSICGQRSFAYAENDSVVSKFRHGSRNISSKDMVDKKGNSYFYDSVLQHSEWRQRQDQREYEHVQDKNEV